MAASASGSPNFPKISAFRRTTAKSPGVRAARSRDAGRRRELEVPAERLLHLTRCKVVQPHLEDESPQRRRIEVLTEVRGAGERERMALHPGQHFVDLAHLPAPVRGPPIGEQRVCFVEDEKCLGVARFGERGRDLLLGLADPGRQKIGRPLLQDLEAKALCEVARERALAGPGRTLEAEREASPGVPDETLGKDSRIGIRLDEPEIEARRRTLRRLLAPEHPRKAPNPVTHFGDASAREPGGGGRPGSYPGGGLELPCERERIFTRGLDAVARELPRPDPGPHSRRRAAELEREHHAPEDGLAHPAGAVHGPEGRRRRRLEQPVHECLGARVPEACT